MTWTPGASGNPKGRPKKGRALTDILEKAGAATVPNGDGKKKGRKTLLAEMLWEAAITGLVTFPAVGETEARVEALAGDDWLGVVKFLYQHIDGPPKQTIDLTSDEQPIAINFVRVEGRNPSPDPSPYTGRGEETPDV